jgi:hypothetical protein
MWVARHVAQFNYAVLAALDTLGMGYSPSLRAGMQNTLEFIERVDTAERSLDAMSSAFDILTDRTAEWRGELRQTMQELSRVPDELDDILGMIGTDASGAPVSRPEGGTSVSRSGAERNLRAGRGGGGGESAAAQAMNQAVLDFNRQRLEDERELLRIEEERREARRRGYQASLRQHAELMAAMRAELQAVDEDLAALDAAEALSGRIAFQERQDAITKDAERLDYWEDRIHGIMDASSNVWQTMASAMSQVGAYYQEQVASITEVMKAQGASNEQIAQATKSQRETIEALQKAEGVFLVAYNISMAVTEVAKAIGSYPDPAGIIAHSASAAAHVVAAGVAAARLGGGAASAPTVSAAGTFKPSATDKVPEQSGEGGGVTIVKNYYLSENMAQLGVAAERGRYEMRRQNTEAGLPNVGWDV